MDEGQAAVEPRERQSAPRNLTARLLAAQLINEIGNGVTTIALPLLVFSRTQSITSTSLVFAANALPSVAFGLLGGVRADRSDRQRVVLTCSAAAGVVLLAVPGVVGAVGVMGAVAVSLLVKTLTSFSGPSFRASLPSLLGDSYKDYVGKRAGLSFFAQTVGPAVGGGLVGAVGAANAVIVNGVSFLVYALIVASIKGFDANHHERRLAARSTTALHDLREGLRHARANSGARALLVYWFLSLTAVPIALLSAIEYVRVDLHQSNFRYGLAVSFYAASSLVSSYLAARLRFRGGARRCLVLSGVGYGLANVAMVGGPGYIAFCLLWVLWGLSYGPEEVVGQLAFAQLVPEQYQGRMFALMNVTLSGAGLVGALLAGPIGDALGARWAMAVAGLIFIAATLGSFLKGSGARALRGVSLADGT